jgi:hypothetical protein
MSAVLEDQIRAANNRRVRRRRALINAGQWEPFVDSGPVREHVNLMRATGMSVGAICKATGLPRGALDYLLWGDTAHGPSRTTLKEHADVLLAYWPCLDDFPDAALIDACGFRRRTEALMLRGFTLRMLAGRCGVSEDRMGSRLRSDRVRAQLVRAVRGVYDELWDKQPEDYGIAPHFAARQRRIAVGRGYVSALAWDDDTIDDPAAVPALDAERPAGRSDDVAVARWLAGESIVLDAVGRRAVITHLMEWSALTIDEIGERLGIEGAAVHRSWERVKSRAKKSGQAVPQRRLYVAALPERRSGQEEFSSVA